MARGASLPAPRAPTPSSSSLYSPRDLILCIGRAAESANTAASGMLALNPHLPPAQNELIYHQVIVSLTQLQSAVSDLTRAYINHANTVLNRSPTGLDMAVGGIASGITANLLETGLLSAPRAVSPGARSETGGEKKKRKRAPPDPNAPKRALTPFFLYMQNNRSRIAEELGDNARPKEVADEGTRRWAEMPDAQKEVRSSLMLSTGVFVCSHALTGLEEALRRQPGHLQGEDEGVQGGVAHPRR